MITYWWMIDQIHNTKYSKLILSDWIHKFCQVWSLYKIRLCTKSTHG